MNEMSGNGGELRIKREDTVLVAIDFQERLLPVIHEGDSVVTEAAKLIRGFEALGCPVLVTQQYTRGLGESVKEIQDACTTFSHIEKDTFSAMGEQSFIDALSRTGRETVVICGVEAHVCVLQTALDLLEAGYDVFVCVDAISSRKERDKDAAVKRMIHSGIAPVTTESVLFELLDNDAKSDTFKTISRLVK